MPDDPDKIRPTKKQRELLTFIEAFITEHGYSPSYREIMAGCDYTSVATVALHVNNLIRRGHLQKRGHSARSLELNEQISPNDDTPTIKPSETKWLIDTVDQYFVEAEQNPKLAPKKLDELYVLVGALKVIGLEDGARSFIPRLEIIKGKVKS